MTDSNKTTNRTLGNHARTDLRRIPEILSQGQKISVERWQNFAEQRQTGVRWQDGKEDNSASR